MRGGSGNISFATTAFFARFVNALKIYKSMAAYRVSGYFMTRQTIPRWLFTKLHRVAPTLKMRRYVMVTRYEDVLSVLNRGVDFELGEFARKRMLAGSFVLNIDWQRTHADQRAAIMDVFQGSDAQRIANITTQACQGTLNVVDDELDVAELSREAAMAVVEQFYGIPRGTVDKEILCDWLTRLASAIILLPPEGTKDRQRVEAAAEGLYAHVQKTMLGTGQNSSATLSHRTILDRLIMTSRATHSPAWLDDKWVARTICGLVIFGMATVVRTAVDTIDELISRPDVLRQARQAASNRNNPYLLRSYIHEALRFRPMLPFLGRFCPRDETIAKDSDRFCHVEAGSTVLAPPLAALHDHEIFPDPSHFRIDRENKPDLIFGAGMHECLGRHFADAALTEIVRAVLRQPTVKRRRGWPNRVVYEGAAAAHLFVRIV